MHNYVDSPAPTGPYHACVVRWTPRRERLPERQAELAGGILVHRHRYRQITSSVSRHGLWWLVAQFGLDRVPVLGRIGFRRSGQHEVTQPRHFRLALEELGTTFIKLGQILSTREDLLPPEYIAELSQLQEHAPEVPVTEIIPIIEAELRAPLTELFATFEPVPIASASIGQVHAATLQDGSQVVVKVQKPGVPEQVAEDLAILRQLAEFAERHSPLAEDYDLVDMVEEFAWTLRNELDYLREGRNADHFRTDFAGSPDVVIPRIIWERTSKRVLTMERIEGIHIDDIAGLDAAGIDRPALARRAAGIIFDEVFVHRFFHADPHPGNFVVLQDGRVVPYDFGMVGYLSARRTRGLLSLLRAVTREDADGVIDAAIDLDIVRDRLERAELTRDIERLLQQYQTLRVEEYDFDQVVRDVTDLIRHHRLRLPGDLALLLKTLVMHEAGARKIDPQFSPIEVARPYAQQMVMDRYRPSTWLSQMFEAGDELYDLLLEGPKRVDRLLTLAEKGKLQGSIRLTDADYLLAEVQVLVNRLVVRGCYALPPRSSLTIRPSISVANATRCSPATVSGKRS
jgi:ubiquinone biosynthesis protein